MLFKMKNEEYILNEELEIDHKMSFLAQPGTAEGFFYLTRPLLLGEAPPLPRPPLLRRGLQPVNRLFCTRKQAHAPAGLLVIAYAIKLRLFDATELRLFVRRGRGLRTESQEDGLPQWIGSWWAVLHKIIYSLEGGLPSTIQERGGWVYS